MLVVIGGRQSEDDKRTRACLYSLCFWLVCPHHSGASLILLFASSALDPESETHRSASPLLSPSPIDRRQTALAWLCLLRDSHLKRQKGICIQGVILQCLSSRHQCMIVKLQAKVADDDAASASAAKERHALTSFTLASTLYLVSPPSALLPTPRS